MILDLGGTHSDSHLLLYFAIILPCFKLIPFLFRYEDVNNYEKKAPHAKRAHPWPDHFYPLHVAMGAAGENSKAELIHRSWGLGTLSYASYKFTSAD